MFEILFGWRKTSTCKKQIKRVQCRLKLLKNKRDSIIRQFRQDVIQLIKNGHEDRALSRIEQLYKDQGLKTLYDLLDSFCEFIIINLPYIRRHRDCPNDINEAVSSLLYASARCGDLPELIKLRKLFSERYGEKFALTAVELLHGNLVNPQIIENLCVKSTPEDFKLNLIKEIARENDLKLDYPGINDELELQQHQQSDLPKRNYVVEWMERESDRDIQFIYDDVNESKSESSCEKRVRELVKSENPASKCKNAAESLQSDSCLDVRNSIEPTTDTQSVSDKVQATISVKEKSHDEMDHLYEDEMALDRSGLSNHGRCSSSTVSSTSVQHKVEKITTAASESPSRFSERSIVYLDDVEELQPIMKEDVQDKDQRLFMFKSKITPVTTNHGGTTISLTETNQECGKPQGQSVRTSRSRNSSKKSSSKKKLKRRYVSVENLRMKDVECALYYGEPDYSSPDDHLSRPKSYPQRKHQRKLTDEESLGSSFTNYRKKLSLPKSPYFYAWRMPEDMRYKEVTKHNMSHKCKFNRTNCGDGNPNLDKDGDRCMDCLITCDDNEDSENPHQMGSTGTKVPKGLPQEKGVDLVKCVSSSDEAFIPNANTNIKGSMDRRKKVTSKVEELEVIDSRHSFASSHDSCSKIASPWKHTRPPYSRALTMPPERAKVSTSNHPLRSTSDLPKSHSNIGSPSYIHPKLPDYDDLAARFKALKKS